MIDSDFSFPRLDNHSPLPDSLVLLAVEGCVLLPRAEMPLNVAEQPLFDIVEAALGEGRMLGVVQPRPLLKSAELANNQTALPLLQSVGCAGRVTSFRETNDGRLSLDVYGTCRFRVSEIIRDDKGIVRVIPDWRPFLGDIGTPRLEQSSFDRAGFLRALKPFLQIYSVENEWRQIQDAPAEVLISSLVMGCPFQPAEKQALIETATLSDRADLLMMLLELSRFSGHDGPALLH